MSITKNWIQSALTALTALWLTAGQAETKFALVNLQKVFDGYYKTRQANDRMQESKSNFEKSRRTLEDDFTKSNDEYKKMVDGTSDPAISTEEKEKRTKEAQRKVTELQTIQRSIRDFDETSNRSLGEQMRRMRDAILREIQEVVAEKGKAGNFTAVLDSGAMSANVAPVFIYTNGENDLTETVLTQMNASAPADALKPKEEKKTEKTEKK